ncbi:MAG: FAD-binding oxidoreductase [Prolixibacteraceae bacterium]|jgi:ferredoxin--NADP+ reductase|nr:FAD-binding oxidoreductase [Prolixibacteraceae bacterium]
MPKAKEYRPPTNELHPVKLTGNREISPGVHVISWKRNSEFLPGQVVKIALNENGHVRIYSLCSGNHEPEMRVLFNIKKGGELTPKLSAYAPGDTIWVSKAYGSFTSDDKPAFWIATGTGIAPFYSMFRSGHAEGKILVHGVRHLNQFYFEDELEWALGKNYVRCCSQEQRCGIFHGRVTDYLKQMENLPSVSRYFLCGKALMVVELRDLLIEQGVPYENIVAEIYF